ncbi:MAG: purine-nucleoside/S-methyl-5-thioadenosine phosphorylase / adenosine deaminase [Solirubrobacteraceae bacterium]|nr:purine-nucleoside/S-methyl-5-thioadenosine phosphorylase / adenosine deaminase [Solirubrobacteraceae bacterium]
MASMPVRAGQPANAATLPAPFRWVGEHIGCALPGGRALFTTRRGGVSAAPYDSLNLGMLTADDAAAVRANRDRVAALTGVARERTMQVMQVHGALVRRVRELPDPAAGLVEADGQATALEGVAVVVLTADCLPVALVAPEGVGVVHAGWRGLAAGVLIEGVRALRELGARGEVRAAIGPGAGACCYETGPEVHAQLASYGPRARRGDNADLKLVARRQLERAGVGEVHDVALCTLCTPPELFFSHRRDGGTTGRQGAVVWRERDGGVRWPS